VQEAHHIQGEVRERRPGGKGMIILLIWNFIWYRNMS
jgi:hypothetical protein